MKLWYDAFEGTSHWELIRRNVDRECDRLDIVRRIWQEFLRELATTYDRSFPCESVDSVLQRRHRVSRMYFFLCGKKLAARSTLIYRYVTLDNLLRHNLRLPVSDRPTMPELASGINRRAITGTNMEGSKLGKPDAPVWCTDDSLTAETSAAKIRNRLGLKNVDGGRLAEIAYPYSLLKSQRRPLHAPTVLDGCASGATNWIFVKNRDPGGPDWGYAVDMKVRRGGRGAREAVHEQLAISPGDGGMIRLRVLQRPLGSSPKPMNFRAMLKNRQL